MERRLFRISNRNTFMPHTSHPPVLVSLTIVRDRPELTAKSAIRSAAMFAVTRAGQTDARFHVDHRAFDRSASRAEIIRGICERIPAGATLLTPVPRIPRGYVKRAYVAGNVPPPADIQLIQRQLPGLDVVPIQCADRHLAEAANAAGIPYADSKTRVLERARGAPHQAQALWQLYLWTQCPPQERVDLSAAWKAWREIERARPLGF